MKKIRLGTRASNLAMWQANEVKKQLLENNKNIEVEIVKYVSSGDKNLEVRLSEIGGKALFTKELDIALINDEIDIAVHSSKDVETVINEVMLFNFFIKRGDKRDVLITNNKCSISDIPYNGIIGTASLRRQYQLQKMRPDLKFSLIRGNVETRIGKIKENEFFGTILANAGLQRLGIFNDNFSIIEVDEMVPSASQGAVGVQCLKNREDLFQILENINCNKTRMEVSLEREFLEIVDGDCDTPIGLICEYSDCLNKLSVYCFMSTNCGNETEKFSFEFDVNKDIDFKEQVKSKLIFQKERFNV